MFESAVLLYKYNMFRHRLIVAHNTELGYLLLGREKTVSKMIDILLNSQYNVVYVAPIKDGLEDYCLSLNIISVLLQSGCPVLRLRSDGRCVK